jgi:hypothetical protein
MAVKSGLFFAGWHTAIQHEMQLGAQQADTLSAAFA